MSVDPFDSYLVPNEELERGSIRLLEVDNRLAVPAFSLVFTSVSSADALHRWALPGLGVKIDANPGRVNSLLFRAPARFGLFLGQCREICGANHSFMPISIERTSWPCFFSWLY